MIIVDIIIISIFIRRSGQQQLPQIPGSQVDQHLGCSRIRHAPAFALAPAERPNRRRMQRAGGGRYHRRLRQQRRRHRLRRRHCWRGPATPRSPAVPSRTPGSPWGAGSGASGRRPTLQSLAEHPAQRVRGLFDENGVLQHRVHRVTVATRYVRSCQAGDGIRSDIRF